MVDVSDTSTIPLNPRENGIGRRLCPPYNCKPNPKTHTPHPSNAFNDAQQQWAYGV